MTLVEDVVPDANPSLALVVGARGGDDAAFAALYEAHHLRVHRLCRGLLGNDDDAADATQETFLRAWRAIGDVHDDDRFGPWLRTIATNVALDVLRGRKRVVAVDELERVRRPVEPAPAVAADDVEALGAALQRLAPRHREVLQLREFAGWSYERIAAEQQLDLSAVKSLLWRARQSLRREFLSLTSGSLGLAMAWFVRGIRRQAAHPGIGSGRVSQLATDLAGSGGAMAAAVVTTAMLPVLAGAPPDPVPVVPRAVVEVVEPAQVAPPATSVLPVRPAPGPVPAPVAVAAMVAAAVAQPEVLPVMAPDRDAATPPATEASPADPGPVVGAPAPPAPITSIPPAAPVTSAPADAPDGRPGLVGAPAGRPGPPPGVPGHAAARGGHGPSSAPPGAAVAAEARPDGWAPGPPAGVDPPGRRGR